MKTFKSDLLRRERQSTIKLLRNKCSCCAPSSPQGLEILWDPIKRRFSYRPQTTQDCLTWVFGIKQDNEARKFRRLNYDTCNVEFLNSDLMNTVSTTAPSVNVKETEKAYIVELAAPGVKKEYCRIHVDEDHNLCVAIENKFEHKEEDKHSHYLRREFSYTNYEQKYSLPDDVNEEEINAKVEDGTTTSRNTVCRMM